MNKRHNNNPLKSVPWNVLEDVDESMFGMALGPAGPMIAEPIAEVTEDDRTMVIAVKLTRPIPSVGRPISHLRIIVPSIGCGHYGCGEAVDVCLN